MNNGVGALMRVKVVTSQVDLFRVVAQSMDETNRAAGVSYELPHEIDVVVFLLLSDWLRFNLATTHEAIDNCKC